MLELVRAAKAIVLVTHDMNWVTEFCNRAMLLEQGQVVAEGEPAEVVRDPPGALGARPRRTGRGGGEAISETSRPATNSRAPADRGASRSTSSRYGAAAASQL